MKNISPRTLLLLVLLLVLASLACGLTFFAQKKGSQSTVAPQTEVPQTYKQVRVDEGLVAFTFEVPENWLVETRNMTGSMDEKTMRAFLNTEYNPNPALRYGDYYDFAINPDGSTGIDTMSFQQMKDIFVERKKQIGMDYPNASISSIDEIWYTDGLGYQVDFYIVPSKEVPSLIQNEKQMEKEWLDIQSDKKLAEMLKSTWEDTTIANKPTKIQQGQLDVLENGERVPTKGLAGGRKYYIDLGQKTLIVDKQAYMSEELDREFDHLLATLKFE